MTYTPYLLPVSVKGIVFDDKKVWLRRNERNEWELPGGKIDPGEQPPHTVERELKEELGISTRVGQLVQAHIHVIPGSIDESVGVLVLAYLCEPLSSTGEFETAGEAGQARFQQFRIDEIPDLKMPDFYKKAISAAWDATLTSL